MTSKPNHLVARPGFTLVEILISLGVFAIGMVAVASLFPVAALLQQETASEVVGEHATASAQAIIEAKGLTFDPVGSPGGRNGDLDGYHAQAGRNRTNVVPLHDIDATLLTRRLPREDRSYPTINDNLNDRDLFWVPFVQDLNGDPNGSNQNWVLRLFVLESDSRATYLVGGSANPNDPTNFPKVVSQACAVLDQDTFQFANANHGLEGGDVFMDSNGTDYRVANVNGRNVTVLGRILLSPTTPNRAWYAPPLGGTGSPALRIVTVKIDPQPAP